jgi:hypothetical protein
VPIGAGAEAVSGRCKGMARRVVSKGLESELLDRVYISADQSLFAGRRIPLNRLEARQGVRDAGALRGTADYKTRLGPTCIVHEK